MTEDIIWLSAIELRRHIGQKTVSFADVLDALIGLRQTVTPGINALRATNLERDRPMPKL